MSTKSWSWRFLTIIALIAAPCALVCCWHVAAHEQDNARQQPDSVDRNYKDELPRIPPREPDQALALFHVAPGFRVEQVAAEPLVVDPVAMAFDEDGQLFVVEMRDYSEDDKAFLGRIRRLTDTDGDGRFDESVVYADELSWPTAVICYDGGIFVAAAPDLFYLKDTNDDGHADEKRVVFTGFERSNVQGLVNSLQWGLDNRIHGATSSSGASLVRPDRPDDPPLVLRGRDFAFDPRTLDIVATSGGAQHGMSFDSWGDKFVCSNSDHLQMVMFEDRYAARNPYVSPPPARQSIAVDGPQADVFRSSPVEPWRILRTRLRVQGLVPGPVEGGGRAAGYFTGATGVTIYTGDNWPQTAQNTAVVGDVGGNLVHRKQLQPQGVGYRGVRIDEQSELLSSQDIWFRPVQFANAPDGTLFVLDMYREVIEHPASLHPVIKQHLDLTSGRDRGRLYRLVFDGTTPRGPQKLSELMGAQLVELLAHPNGWHRATASRLICERQDASLTAALEKLATDSSLPLGRIHALYALDGLSTLTARVAVAALDDEHPHVRRHAVRLSERFLESDPTLRTRLPQLADDSDLRVRYQVAFSLGYMSGPARDSALAQIVLRDGDDPYVRYAVHSSLETGAGNVLSLLFQNPDAHQSEAGRTMWRALAAKIGRQQRSDDVAAVVRLLRDESTKPHHQDLLAALAPKADSDLARQIAVATGGSGGELLAELLKEARIAALDSELPINERIEAIDRLQLSRFADEQKLLAQLLAPDQSLVVQEAGLRTLASFDAPQVADIVVGAWATLSPRLRLKAGDLLFSRPVWISALLDAVEQKSVPAADIPSGQWKWLATHPDPKLRERGLALGPAIASDRQEVLRRYQEALTLEGDALRGKAVFKKTCAACHTAEGQGHAIGPNLAAMKNRGAEAILANVLIPNAEVNPQFVTYAVQTKDGRTLSGVVVEETAAGITLLRAENARDVVLRIDIEEMRSTGLSLMPEGVEKDIDVQGMADLLEYLKTLE